MGQSTELLFFGKGNAKLDEGIWTFSLPAGHFCPFAKQCQSRADRDTGRITDGPHTVFRCYSASEEMWPSIRNSRWRNAELLKGKTREQMKKLILSSLSPYAGWVRLHVSGDFFSQAYFDAWLGVSLERPKTTFYGYTKSLRYWVARKPILPENLVLTASLGGRDDHLVALHGLRSAKVVFSENEAWERGLEIDHDDSHAMNPGPDFALLIHGPQPKGSEAGKAVSSLRKQGEYGYGHLADKRRSWKSLKLLECPA